VRVLLLSTYELGHQPLHVSSPAGALLRAGHDVRCLDLAVEPLDDDALAWSDLVAISVPMHTAMRLAHAATTAVRGKRPELPVCFYGLYAAMDDGGEGDARPDVSIAGEYQAELVSLADRLQKVGADTLARRWPQASMSAMDASPEDPTGHRSTTVRVRLERQRFGVPARHLLPPLERYARLEVAGEARLAGYVEASHGCVHRCRHCPVPVVYDGRTRVVEVDAVLADIAQLLRMGARHVSFGDPDFLSGPAHARRVVAAVHEAFPELTFDVTTKVSHILAHEQLWPGMARSGCLFVVSAFESASDRILQRLDKGHTAADEVEAVAVLRGAGIEPRPSLLPFTPWTHADDIRRLVELVEHCDLVGNVDPVQWSIRLLVPPGSLLLESGQLAGEVGAYDPEHLSFSWSSRDPRLDDLQLRLWSIAEQAGEEQWDAVTAHRAVRGSVEEVLGAWENTPGGGEDSVPMAPDPRLASAMAPDDRPRLSEAWFCCAEPASAHWKATLATNGSRP